MNAKQQGNRNEKVNGGEKDEEGREPGKRQCMGGAKTEDLLMVPSMLCLFPVFCLLLLASLSRTHQRVIITSYPLPLPSQSPALTPSKTLPGLQCSCSCSGSGSGSQRKITSVDVKQYTHVMYYRILRGLACSCTTNFI